MIFDRGAHNEYFHYHENIFTEQQVQIMRHHMRKLPLYFQFLEIFVFVIALSFFGVALCHFYHNFRMCNPSTVFNILKYRLRQ